MNIYEYLTESNFEHFEYQFSTYIGLRNTY